MTKITGYILMIFLSGIGAALSSVLGGAPGMLRGFIFGSVLALSVVLGNYFINKKNNLAQSILGMFLGAVAGTIIVLLKLKIHNREMSVNFNSEFMIILLSIVYGGFFQWIIMSSIRKKALKIFCISFVCISIKLHYVNNAHFNIGEIVAISIFAVLSALIFTILWYLPIWFFYTRKYSFTIYLNSLSLNWRMLKLVLAKRWLSKHDYATSYDKIAATYDEQWLCQLRPVTEKLLNALPPASEGDILDLGCGTGFSTACLEKEYPRNPVFGVDISHKMLKHAKTKCSRAELIKGDILEFLQNRPAQSASLIFSAWAIGYSEPNKIFSEAERVLKTGGTFAFVVNYSDTLKPVFYAFRKCMNEFPDRVNMALNLKFPHKEKHLLKALKKNGFDTIMQEDKTIPIHSPEGEITLEWLLETGVLAGFDQVMPLQEDLEINEYFDKILRKSKPPLAHHYFLGVFTKKRVNK